MRVLDTIASRHSAGTVILASHGNLIALALHAIMPNVDYRVLGIDPDAGGVHADSGWKSVAGAGMSRVPLIRTR